MLVELSAMCMKLCETFPKIFVFFFFGYKLSHESFFANYFVDGSDRISPALFTYYVLL